MTSEGMAAAAIPGQNRLQAFIVRCRRSLRAGGSLQKYKQDSSVQDIVRPYQETPPDLTTDGPVDLAASSILERKRSLLPGGNNYVGYWKISILRRISSSIFTTVSIQGSPVKLDLPKA